MDCQLCRETVSATTDGQASAAEEAAATEHLARCPACRSVAARMRAMTRVLRVRPAPRCPDLTAFVVQAFDAGASEFGAPAAGKPSCVPEHVALWCVGSANCGCADACGCGCQSGGPCRCAAVA